MDDGNIANSGKKLKYGNSAVFNAVWPWATVVQEIPTTVKYQMVWSPAWQAMTCHSCQLLMPIWWWWWGRSSHSKSGNGVLLNTNWTALLRSSDEPWQVESANWKRVAGPKIAIKHLAPILLEERPSPDPSAVAWQSPRSKRRDCAFMTGSPCECEKGNKKGQESDSKAICSHPHLTFPGISFSGAKTATDEIITHHWHGFCTVWETIIGHNLRMDLKEF